jgi:glycolate oxidase FAD binding subunit
VGVSASAVVDALTAAVGSGFFRGDPDSLASYAVDGVLPRWVAFPGSVQEASRVVALAAEERLALVPRGSGTRSSLGNVPARVDLVLDLSRLSAIAEYAPDDLTVTLGAGTTLETLARHLDRCHQFLPLDPLDGPRRTTGGVTATDGSGPLRFRYGTARDLLLGVRFIEADGTVTSGGAKVVKSVTGYDMPKLMVGALGSLGVLVELTLRLHPQPEVERSWLVSFDSADRAEEFLRRVLDSSLQPNRLELLSGEALRAEGRHGTVGTAVALSVGSVPEAVESQGEAALGLARALGGEGKEVGHTDFWSGLGTVIHGGRNEHTVVLKVTTLVSNLVRRAVEVETLGRGLGFQVALVAEAGNGVLHARLSGALAPEKWDRLVIAPLRDRLTAEGGSCVLEEASRALKERVDVWGPLDPAAFAIMKRLKDAFDPQSVLNPGRFVGRL